VLVPVGHIDQGADQDWAAMQHHARRAVLEVRA